MKLCPKCGRRWDRHRFDIQDAQLVAFCPERPRTVPRKAKDGKKQA